jgi:hypothetical protein
MQAVFSHAPFSENAGAVDDMADTVLDAVQALGVEQISFEEICPGEVAGFPAVPDQQANLESRPDGGRRQLAANEARRPCDQQLFGFRGKLSI